MTTCRQFSCKKSQTLSRRSTPWRLGLSDAPWDVTKAILLNLQPLDSYRLIGNAWWDQPIPALELLTAVAYTIPDGLELAKAVMPKFEAIHAVIRYRSALQGILRATGTENPEGPLSTYLMTTAKDWLTAAGYQAGIVCTGLHRDRPQLFVGDGTTRYVADRSSACHPEEGEHVLFHPRSGKSFPTSRGYRIVAVTFVPVYN